MWNESHLKTRGSTLATPNSMTYGPVRTCTLPLCFRVNEWKKKSNRKTFPSVTFVCMLVHFWTGSVHSSKCWLVFNDKSIINTCGVERILRFSDVREWNILCTVCQWYICSFTAFTRSHCRRRTMQTGIHNQLHDCGFTSTHICTHSTSSTH